MRMCPSELDIRRPWMQNLCCVDQPWLSSRKCLSAHRCISSPFRVIRRTSIPPVTVNAAPNFNQTGVSERRIDQERGDHLQIVKVNPTPIELIIGRTTAMLAAPNEYCTIYLQLITSDRCCGRTSSRYGISEQSCHRHTGLEM